MLTEQVSAQSDQDFSNPKPEGTTTNMTSDSVRALRGSSRNPVTHFRGVVDATREAFSDDYVFSQVDSLFEGLKTEISFANKQNNLKTETESFVKLLAMREMYQNNYRLQHKDDYGGVQRVSAYINSKLAVALTENPYLMESSLKEVLRRDTAEDEGFDVAYIKVLLNNIPYVLGQASELAQSAEDTTRDADFLERKKRLVTSLKNILVEEYAYSKPKIMNVPRFARGDIAALTVQVLYSIDPDSVIGISHMYGKDPVLTKFIEGGYASVREVLQWLPLKDFEDTRRIVNIVERSNPSLLPIVIENIMQNERSLVFGHNHPYPQGTGIVRSLQITKPELAAKTQTFQMAQLFEKLMSVNYDDKNVAMQVLELWTANTKNLDLSRDPGMNIIYGIEWGQMSPSILNAVKRYVLTAKDEEGIPYRKPVSKYDTSARQAIARNILFEIDKIRNNNVDNVFYERDAEKVAAMLDVASPLLAQGEISSQDRDLLKDIQSGFSTNRSMRQAKKRVTKLLKRQARQY